VKAAVASKRGGEREASREVFEKGGDTIFSGEGKGKNPSLLAEKKKTGIKRITQGGGSNLSAIGILGRKYGGKIKRQED